MSVPIDRALAGAIVESVRAASTKDRVSFWQVFGSSAFPGLAGPVAEAVNLAAAVELVASRLDGGLAFLDDNHGLAEAGRARLGALEVRQGLYERARHMPRPPPGAATEHEYGFARLFATLAVGDVNGANDILRGIDWNVRSLPVADVFGAYILFKAGKEEAARDRLNDGIQKLQHESLGPTNSDFWKAMSLAGIQDDDFVALAAERFAAAGSGLGIDTAAMIAVGLASLPSQTDSRGAVAFETWCNGLATLLQRRDARAFLDADKWLRAVELFAVWLEQQFEQESGQADLDRLRKRPTTVAETVRVSGRASASLKSIQSPKGKEAAARSKGQGGQGRGGARKGVPEDERALLEAKRRLAHARIQKARLRFATGREKNVISDVESGYKLLDEKRDVRVVQLARPIDIPSIPSVSRFAAGAPDPVSPSPISRVDADPVRSTYGMTIQWAAEVEGASVLTGHRSGSVFWYVTTRDGWMLADGLNVHPRLHFGSYHERMSALSPSGRVLIDGPAASKTATRFPGRSVLLGGVPNYYHWLMEYLPKIGVLESLMPVGDAAVTWLVNDSLAPWQAESLSMLGVSIEHLGLVRAGTTARCDSLVTPSMMSAADATAFLRQRFNAERPLEGERKIYVSRLDADPARRRVHHEELLVAALQQAGFEILVPSEMSFLDQVEAFASATVIVGPHGAGMTNLAFAQKESLVVEIVNTHNRSYRFFSDIADAVGLRYARFLSGSERANFIEPENANSIIDPNRLLSFIDQMQAG